MSGEEGSLDTAGASQRSKRPRRAASGGVLGAVAAEAACWPVDEAASPPFKRAASAPQSAAAGSRRGVSERVALLKKALAGDVGANCGGAPATLRPAATCGLEAAAAGDEEDAVSALFELSSSLC